jgi:short-subunit dehydrogenase
MFSKSRCFVVITGASRGLGRSIGVALAGEVGDHSTFLLLSRSVKDLEITKSNLEEKFSAKKLQVIVRSVDNETADRSVYESCFDEALTGENDLNRFLSI